MTETINNLEDGLKKIKEFASYFRTQKSGVNRITIGITSQRVEDRLVQKVLEQPNSSPTEYRNQQAGYFIGGEHFLFFACEGKDGKSATDIAKEIEKEAHKMSTSELYGLSSFDTVWDGKDEKDYGKNADKVYFARW